MSSCDEQQPRKVSRARRWVVGSPKENRTVERDLLRRLRRELTDLGIEPPLDAREVCRAVAKRRGRPLFVRAARLEKPGPSGLWINLPEMDVIVYQEETTELHQEHIILHELWHLLLSEDPDSGEPVPPEEEDFAEGWAWMIPAFDPSLVKRVARRCSYTDGEECEVELAATILLERSERFQEEARAADPAVRRVESALGGRGRWL